MSYADLIEHLRRAVGRRRIPLAGHVELTYRCPFRCVHCYQCGLRGAPELETAEWLRLLDEAASSGCLWLTLSGGDPLVRHDFEAIYSHAVRRGFLVTLFTNGVLISERAADLLAALPPQAVEITMYGATAGAYAAVTGDATGLRRMTEGVERLRARGVPLRLKTVLLRETVAELEEMERFAARIGAPFRFEAAIHLDERGGGRAPAHRLDSAAVVAVEAARPERVDALRSCVVRPGPRDRALLYQCGAGRWFFGIDPAGRLRLCPTVPEPSFPLREMGLAEAWERAAAELERPLGDSPCGTCDLIDACPRCPGLARMESGDAAGSSRYFGEIAERRALAVGHPRPARCMEVHVGPGAS